jgi:hypothetical protein
MNNFSPFFLQENNFHNKRALLCYQEGFRSKYKFKAQDFFKTQAAVDALALAFNLFPFGIKH